MLCRMLFFLPDDLHIVVCANETRTRIDGKKPIMKTHCKEIQKKASHALQHAVREKDGLHTEYMEPYAATHAAVAPSRKHYANDWTLIRNGYRILYN